MPTVREVLSIYDDSVEGIWPAIARSEVSGPGSKMTRENQPEHREYSLYIYIYI